MTLLCLIIEPGPKTVGNEFESRSYLDDEDMVFDSRGQRTRRFKSVLEGNDDGKSITKWTQLAKDIEDETTTATSRAKLTKARLNDIELELEEMNERQAKRERRIAALKPLANEIDFASQQNLNIEKKFLTRIEKHVRF